MATSGDNTGTLRPYTARHMVENALRRAGIPPPKFTAEILQTAYDELNVMFDEMLNLGIQLWARDKVIVPLYENTNQAVCPAGTSVVISVNQRSLMRVEADSTFTDQGGSSANAFDDDFETVCAQTAINGSIGAYFEDDTQITTVGVLFTATGTFAITYEFTTDSGSTWFEGASATYTVLPSTVFPPAQQWEWIDIPGLPNVNGARIRSTSTSNLSVAEIFFGNTPTEIPMGVWSLDDWNAMVNKATPGRPWNWYQNRGRDLVTLYVWPMPDDTSKYYQLVVWRRRYLDTVSAMTQTLDVSRRWYEALTASLARRFCRSLPEADINRYAMLEKEETNSTQLAIAEERDPAPIRYNPGLNVYSRIG